MLKRLTGALPAIALVVMLLAAGIAAAPADLPRPRQPSVTATGNAGELYVTWPDVAGAQFYTVGWIARGDYEAMRDAGRSYLDAFQYATIPAQYTHHTIGGLRPGEDHVVIVGARLTRSGGASPAWSGWSNLVATAGQHGEGFCPITGLPLPPGGYLGAGDTQTFGIPDIAWVNVTLASASVRNHLTLGDGSDYRAPRGFKLLQTCVRVENSLNPGSPPVYFEPGRNNNLSTDRGIGFFRFSDWADRGISRGERHTGCDVWAIPESATTAVYAIGYAFDRGTPGDTLYRIDLP